MSFSRVARFIPNRFLNSAVSKSIYRFSTIGAITALFGSLVGIGVLKAQNVIVGLPPDPGTAACLPFGCANVPNFTPLTEYQQIYDKTLFSGPIVITGLTFYKTQLALPGGDFVTPAFYTITLSTASESVTSNFQKNIGCDYQVFFSGALGGLVGGRLDIAGEPFLYDPKMGSLVLDVKVSNSTQLSSSQLPVGLDTHTGGGLIHGWVGYSINHGFLYSGGLVTGFSTTVPVTSKGSCQPVTLDPVPSLLNGPAVTEDADKLASEGRVVQGAAADGVSQLVVKIPAHSVGEHFAVSVINDAGAQSHDSSADGDLVPIGANASKEGLNTLTVAAISTSLGPMAFAIFRAPIDFARSSIPNDDLADHRAVAISVVASDTGASTLTPITIVRPPVVLVHGNWSNSAQDWAFFQFSQNPPPIQIYRADYSAFLSQGVVAASAVTLAQVQQFIESYKQQTTAVAAVQADLVAYSLGGLVSRALVTRRFYANSFNYQAGYVHKLITLDTPHWGAELASALQNSSATCRTLFSTFVGPVAQNVKDMSPNSPLLLTLSTTNATGLHLPTVVIGTNAAGTQVDAANNAFFNSVLYQITPLIHGPCRSLLPAGGYQALFANSPAPGNSDLIVSTYSQLGIGLGIGGSIPSWLFSGYIHDVNATLFPIGPDVRQSNLAGSTRVSGGVPFPSTEQILQLLNTPVAEFRPIAP